MKNYETMTVVELVYLVRLQDRIISSLTRELKLSRRDFRKTPKVPPTDRGKRISEGRLRLLTPERRSEISRMGQQAMMAKRKSRTLQMELVDGACNG